MNPLLHPPPHAASHAYVPPNRVYNQEIIKWIGDPLKVELDFVKRLRTHIIPDDYLKSFEAMLQNLTDEILHGTGDKAQFLTWVNLFEIIILRDMDDKTVIVRHIITRPCAERKGFTRIILFHIMRVCYAADYELVADQPSLEMVRLLESAFDSGIVHEFDLGNTNRPFRVNLRHRLLSNPWVALPEDLRDKLVFDNTQADDDLAPPSIPHLRPEYFPTARELNGGPLLPVD